MKKKVRIKFKKSGLVLVLLLFFTGLHAQDINSPFSAYGIGQLYGENISSQLQAMGGISYGVTEKNILNMANPASYGVFDSLTYIFQTGIIGNVSTLQNTQEKQSSNYATLSNISMGFQATRWWHVAFGVTPFSKVGYDTRVSALVPPFGSVYNDRYGKGGTSLLFFGNAFKVTKNLRLGVNINYLFGNGRGYNIIYFPDSIYIFGTKQENYIRLSDFLFDWGVQYDIHLAKGRKLTLGAIYRNGINVHAVRSNTTYTLTGGYDNFVDYPRDTIDYSPEESGSVYIPATYGLGFTYSQGDRWLVGMDGEWQQWSKFRKFGEADSLQDSWRVAIGGAYTPKHTTISPLRKRMTYRLGARFNQTYVRVYGYSINEFAITGGFTFPFKHSRNNITFAMELGSRGALKDHLVKKTFFNFSLGINIVETWFYKRKYR
ncbi:hypothetical protein LA303_02510 [Candidatus Sulfidibacterium hydrothermale]|uniref:hypothetical protein n=1 Tax=Candidatus Sulfidibacterium hydrothermale TaxID=2875962 RepID=UPI001F0B0D83|nr:hypothetical protein [Candidatus Sulfidibacterium hydrothermale]UBM62862.1 hypothetical protein LA303_02510 [Candidatus Sulfidibacterium hydrothermale]